MAKSADYRTWRVAILGGRIGTEHLAGWLASAGRFRVVCICDLDLALARRLACEVRGREGGEQEDVARTSDAIDSVIADPDIDIVDICLPPALHAPVAAAALRAGKHVVCEKPLAGSVVAAEQLASIASETGRLLVPMFQYRFGRGLTVLQRLQAAGLAGPAVAGSLETHWDRGADYYRSPWRGTWAGELGGVVLTHAIHVHDLAVNCVGPIAAVSAFAGTRSNPVETEDCAAVCMSTVGGALITSSATLGAARNTSRLRLVFEKLTAESGTTPYAPGHAGWRFTARRTEDQERVDRAVSAPGRVGRCGYAGLFGALAERLAGGDLGVLPTPEDGVASIELASAITLAARSGRSVPLPLDRQLPICRGLAPAKRAQAETQAGD